MTNTRQCARCGTTIELFDDQNQDAVACPQCGARAPSRLRALHASALVQGADKPPRRLVIMPILLSGLGLAALVGLVLWEPWNIEPELIVDSSPPPIINTDQTTSADSGTEPETEASVDQQPKIAVPPGSLKLPATERVPLVWNGTPPRFPLSRGNKTVVSVSGHPVQYLALDGTVYAVKDGSKLAEVSIEGTPLQSAVAPDGSRLAVASKVGEIERLFAYSLDGDRTAKELQFENRDRPIRFMAFTDCNTLMTQLGLGIGAHLAEWDLRTGKLLRRVDAPSFTNDMATLSANGRLLAIATSGSVQIISTDKVGAATEMKVPVGLESTPLSNCTGLAFSPSGEELAALLPNHRIVVWSIEGEVLMDHTLYLPDAEGSDAHAKLQWLSDRRGWVLYGNTVCLCDPVLAVWKIEHRASYRSFPNIVVDSSHLLIGGGRGDVGRLAAVTLPWVQINKAVTQIDQRNPIFGAPTTVQVAISANQVRGASREVVEQRLNQAIKARLAQLGIGTSDDAPVILFVDHSEAVGAIKAVTFNGNSERINGTKINQRFELRSRNSTSVLWADQFELDSGVELHGLLQVEFPEEINEMGLRDRAFDDAITRMGRLKLPTVIHNLGQKQLPIRARY